ncbi:MAG: DUF1501 domain-containing protein [Planctomycetota bacterium]
MSNPLISRRGLLQSATAATSSGLLPKIAAAAKQSGSTGRHCILLWMSGGPSQIDTFDLKPDHANGGEFEAISTKTPGVEISQHLPKLAQHSQRLAIMRGLSTKEGDHQRGTVLMRTGHSPGGPVAYPSIGCSLSKELGNLPDASLPDYVSISPGAFANVSVRPGFLGPRYAATSVASRPPANDGGFAQLNVNYLRRPPTVSQQQHEDRLRLWTSMQSRFRDGRETPNVLAQDLAYQSALRMLSSDAGKAFELDQESDQVRQRYGRSGFGQGCLMARRLVERGVRVVEVTLGDGLGWDTHTENFDRVKTLSETLDQGWATLMDDLSATGLIEHTTILWAGEFGRTPVINAMGGRDHFPQAFSCVLAGGGVAGGQVYGQTSADGSEVIDGKMDQQDLLATLCAALQIKPLTENIAEGGRPISIAEGDVVDQLIRS